VIVKFLISARLPSKKDDHHPRAFGTESEVSILVPIGEARFNAHVVDATIIHAPKFDKESRAGAGPGGAVSEEWQAMVVRDEGTRRRG